MPSRQLRRHSKLTVRVRCRSVRILSEAEVREHLDPVALISDLEAAFRDRFSEIIIPTRMHLSLADGLFLIMPCYDRVGGALGMKLVTVQNHPQESEERVQATLLLFDPQTGSPRLQMPARYLTEVRTAAASALATRILAREDVATLGVFGAGRQARSHLRLLTKVRNFARIMVCTRDSARARTFAQQMSLELGLPAEPCDATTCAASADVLCTCTTSPSPLFDGNALRPGTHLNLVGAFQPHTREVDSITVKRSAVAVDTYDGAFAEAGDLLLPMREGVIRRDHLQWDLHELTKKTPLARTSREQITLFKSVGTALEDLIAAEQIERSLVRQVPSR